MNHKSLKLFILFFLITSLHSQSNNNDPLGGYGFHLQMSDYYNSSPNITNKADQHRGTFHSVDLNFATYDFDNVDRVMARIHLMGDLFELMGYLLDAEEILENKNFGTSLSGWLWYNSSLGAIVKGDMYNIGWGYHSSDYQYRTDYRVEDRHRTTGDQMQSEPTGWWYTVGPMVFSDIIFSEGISLHLLANYGVSLFRLAEGQKQFIVDDYKTPHFVFFNATINFAEDYYFLFDYTTIIDRGSHEDNGHRIDFGIGYYFEM